jgi:hypothetical protein
MLRFLRLRFRYHNNGLKVPEQDPEPDPYLWLVDPDPGGPQHLAPDSDSQHCHKVHICTEYRSVCPLVRIGTLPTPLSPASVPLTPKSDDQKKKLSTLHTRWLIVTSVPDVWHFGTDIYIRIHYTLNNRFRIRNALKLADSLNIIIQK